MEHDIVDDGMQYSLATLQQSSNEMHAARKDPIATGLRLPLRIGALFFAKLATQAVALCVLAACSSRGHSATTSTSFTVAGTQLRSCDLVFDIGETPIASMHFTQCAGAFFQRAPKLGVSISATKDEDLAKFALFTIDGNREHGPKVTSARCYDRSGRVVEGARVENSP